jgi:hypothetical protein
VVATAKQIRLAVVVEVQALQILLLRDQLF